MMLLTTNKIKFYLPRRIEAAEGNEKGVKLASIQVINQ